MVTKNRTVFWCVGCCGLLLFGGVLLTGCPSPPEDDTMVVKATPTPPINYDVPFELLDPLDREFVRRNLYYYTSGLVPAPAFREELLAGEQPRVEATVAKYEDILELRRTGEFGAAIQALERLGPLNIPAYHHARGFLELLSQNSFEAEKFFQKALELDPEYLPSLQNMAYLAFNQEKLDQCHGLLAQALEKRPRDQSLWLLDGVTMLGQGKFRVASNSFYKAMEIFSHNYILWYHWGTSYFLDGRFRQAEEAYARAQELNPREARILMRRAKSLFRLDRVERGLELMESYIELQPHDPEGYFLIARIQEYLQQPEQAHARYDQVLDLYPGNVRAMLYKAELLLKQNKLREAIPVLEDLREKAPNNYQANILLADSHYQLRKFEDAIKCLDQALALKDDDPEVWIQRGQAYFELNARPQAMESFERAKTLIIEAGRDQDQIERIQKLIGLITRAGS
jgi:tetratricopeptide (TPR) repeat protein